MICPICNTDHVTEREAKRIKAYVEGPLVSEHDDGDEDTGPTVHDHPGDAFDSNPDTGLGRLIVACEHPHGFEREHPEDPARCPDCLSAEGSGHGLKTADLVCLVRERAEWMRENGYEVES